MIWKVLKYIFIRMRGAKRALGKSSHNSWSFLLKRYSFLPKIFAAEQLIQFSRGVKRSNCITFSVLAFIGVLVILNPLIADE